MAQRGSKSTPRTTRPNTIGLTGTDFHRLLDTVESTADSSHKRRAFVRWSFRQASIPMALYHPGSESLSAQLVVATRNLSRFGISVLHNAYIHVGSRVRLSLPHPKNGPQIVEGVVVRCAHVSGLIHEVGIRFVKPIDARAFVELEADDHGFMHERVEPEKLAGCLVYIDDSELDHKIITHFLRDTQLKLRSATTAEEGLKLAAEPCDVLLVDLDLPGMSGSDLIEKLRADGVDTPCIVVTSEPEAHVDREGLRVSSVLTKPLAQDTLLRALAEISIGGESSGAMKSSLAADDPNFPLVAGFVEQLRVYAKKLEEALKGDDAEACRSICNQIRGVAPTVGFAELGSAAEAAALALAKGGVKPAARQVRALIASCERIQP